MLLSNYSQKVRHWAADRYFDLARTTEARRLHNQLRIWRHHRRYGVKSAFMFRAVELEINSMCNRTCSYCPNVSEKRPPGYMKEELFRKIIDELGDIKFDGRISYHFYGEPLLDKRLLRFVEYTTARVPQSSTEIYSNGDFLTLELFRKYVDAGLTNFLITQHDNCIPPNLQRILDAITEDEKKHLVIRFAKDRFMINRSGLIKTLHTIKEPLHTPCDWPLTSVVVTLTGNVVLCCNDYHESEVMGNLVNQTIAQVWTGPRFEKFRAALSRGERSISFLCEPCDYVPSPERLRRIVPS